jgi:tetratricopeptide (TPR) repeat protein
MRIIILSGFIISLFLASCNNKQEHGNRSSADSSHLRLFNRAMNIGDFQTAIYAINLHLLDDSTDEKWYDTLAILYLNTNNFLPASFCADKVLKKRPDDIRMLELKGGAEQQLGRRDKILDVYAQLFRVTNDYQYMYQTAAVEFTAGNIERCKVLVDSMMSSPIINRDSIEIQIGEDQSQTVPLKAAVLNLQAFLKARDGNYAEAKKNFEAALKIYPDFVLARRNLQDLMSGGRR